MMHSLPFSFTLTFCRYLYISRVGMVIPLWPKNENTEVCRSATSVDVNVNDLSIGAQSRRNTHAKISVFGGKNDGRASDLHRQHTCPRGDPNR